MKKNFEHSLDMILEHEGGYVNHPRDPGGMTNLGVTKRVYEKWLDRKVSEQDMRDLTVSEAAPIYKAWYWDRLKCDSMRSGVDFCVFDLGVNGGVGRAARMLQRSVGAKPDGAIGPKTLALVDATEAHVLINEFTRRREAFYRRLKTFKTFGRGWLARNEKTQIAALAMIRK